MQQFQTWCKSGILIFLKPIYAQLADFSKEHFSLVDFFDADAFGFAGVFEEKEEVADAGYLIAWERHSLVRLKG